MLTTPTPSTEETRTNAAFDALLWALSRPGLTRTLPEPGVSSIIGALLDRECQVYSANPLLIPAITQTGAALCDLPVADHVFMGRIGTADLLRDVAQGSDLYPDDGATVIAQATLADGPRLRLTGPGVNGALEVRIGGLPDGFWQTRAAVMRYPMGFELLLIDGSTVLGLPRSTNIEVL